jgi:DNA-binding NtrC family response regulator
MPSETSPAKPRVLVVDDEEQFTETIRYALSESFDVVTRNDPKSALDLLKKEDFLLVISDYMMPGMNGMELLDKVRAQPRFTAGLLVTAHMEVLTRPEWLDGRHASILFKPFAQDDLVKSAQQMVSLAQMRRKVREGVLANPISKPRG